MINREKFDLPKFDYNVFLDVEDWEFFSSLTAEEKEQLALEDFQDDQEVKYIYKNFDIGVKNDL